MREPGSKSEILARMAILSTFDGDYSPFGRPVISDEWAGCGLGTPEVKHGSLEISRVRRVGGKAG